MLPLRKRHAIHSARGERRPMIAAQARSNEFTGQLVYRRGRIGRDGADVLFIARRRPTVIA